ncbi:MAG: hypothetical protein AAGC65_04230 [Mucilaginibacter sp.]|uniref:hypothetical protein n=1 Tax=Mucilaginibacter sp. TaxID=1882438 RepID=UPI0031A453E2
MWIDYTVTSDQNMYGISLLEVGTNTSVRKIVLDESRRRSFSEIIKLKATNRVGKTSYRLYPTDKLGVYMGDGYKVLTIEVKNNFDLTTERPVQFADSAAVDAVTGSLTYTVRPQAKSFFSFDESKAYSYEEAGSNSGKIDVGIYMKRTAVKNSGGVITVTDNYFAYTPTSIKLSTLPFTGFDISTWEKRNTLLGVTTQNLTNFIALKTGTQIITAATAAKTTQTSVEIKSGIIFYFLSQEGRYGAVYVDKIGYDKINGYYANFLIKYAYPQ